MKKLAVITIMLTATAFTITSFAHGGGHHSIGREQHNSNCYDHTYCEGRDTCIYYNADCPYHTNDTHHTYDHESEVHYGSGDHFVSGDTTDNTNADGLDIRGLKLPINARRLVIIATRVGSAKADYSYYTKENGSWKESNSDTAYIGKGGIGKTKEGDLKTPSGLYMLNTPFGNASPKEGFPKDYLKVSDDCYWNCDPKSQSYNTLVSTKTCKDFDKSKSEHLNAIGAYYDYCFNISYNDTCKKDAGSAIFLHCDIDHSATHGCVAISKANMEKLMKEYDPLGTYIYIY